ncbi:type II toxin-antitoxin system ParD family antitoxin [Patescibacteria group bacterium]|nr:type II toxin-antitoxin system ParD family antitoxin [Patescibacteria group bacterium]MCG2702597.1 type II toxin-antitoxin system ParD family antitoxin [Candidatus Parcubacteria bacterium]MBU4210615.1 type II toxin-antitoxin system ParD family antitoxin [Patescibacteria group bacterium]MBU4265509.1 type II toxin-antitoxin system ParD family antitoxin [Patescibacteria group bacterium]MBU4390559.1 type II toxin-antitoxin system ParD family antitoxin [Patescibacteria group bacterium]
MNTVNISLPLQLQVQAKDLVNEGFYASFSDLVRTALRKLLSESKYDVWAKEAKSEYKLKKGKILESDKDIDEYFDSLK